jgi:amino acid transporter
MVATVVLVIFSVGYIEMARHVTASGGFYSFVSHGFGQIFGLGTAAVVAFCYAIFTGAIIGVTSYWAHSTFSDWFSVSIPVWAIMAVILAISLTLAFFRIQMTTNILGVFMLAELAALLVFGAAVLFSGGNSGLGLAPLNPANLFSNSSATAVFGASAVGIALFGAFWSWVGFEMGPNYGEESRDPKRIIPRATYGSVIALGVLFTFVAYMFVEGWGQGHATGAIKAQFGGQFASAFYPLTGRYFGSSLTHVFEALVITSGFAAQLAFFNTTSRYLFSMGREGILPRVLARTHPKYRSPHIASVVAAAVVGVHMLGFVIDDPSPSGALLKLGTWGPLLGVMGLLAIQALVCFAIIRYFLTTGRDHFHPFKTFVAPLIGAAGMIGAIYLLLANRATLSGAGSAFYVEAIPWVIALVFLLGVLLAVTYRTRDRPRYEAIGRFVHEDV